MTAADSILEVRDVAVHFGGIVALDGISFNVPRNSILGLIGPNGAGKTTLFNCLSCLYVPTRGDILFDRRSILGTASHRMASIGIGRTFQNLALFHRMSVLDNVLVGAQTRGRSDFVSNALRLPWMRREERMLEEKAWGLLEYLNLTEVAHLPTGALPFGTQKRVELARALATKPRLLLLDEWLAGLNPTELQIGIELIRRIRGEGITIVMIEHVMEAIRALCDRVVVMNVGERIAEGTAEAVLSDPAVMLAYLGDDDVAA